MRNILYLAHRLPYPPNKGDKVRSFNLLKYLSAENNVYLGTFVDDPDDVKYIPIVRELCKSSYFEEINWRYSRIRSLSGIFKGQALTLSYYESQDFHNWVSGVISKNRIDDVVVFSSAMAQFVSSDFYSRMLVDFVDVDSQKWSEYSDQKYFPMSWLYKREGKLLLNYERFLAVEAKHSFFVTKKERSLFATFAPESLHKTSVLNNGVDLDFFDSDIRFLSPFGCEDDNFISVVFTGAMDYWPNIDAVTWFVDNVFSLLIKKNSKFRFYIVGRNPSQAVLDLRSEEIFVTGTVDDVRPYLRYATVVVAPLRIARGVQNKILEAMSMAKPVVASIGCVRAIDSTDGIDVLAANTPADFVEKIEYLINDKSRAEAIGRAARFNVQKKYSWGSNLKKIDEYLSFDEVEDIL